MVKVQAQTWLNLGPQSRRWLADLGITDPAQLQLHDPYVVYARLKAANPKVSILMLYALIGSIEGVHWQQVRHERRSEILMRLDDMGLL